VLSEKGPEIRLSDSHGATEAMCDEFTARDPTANGPGAHVEAFRHLRNGEEFEWLTTATPSASALSRMRMSLTFSRGTAVTVDGGRSLNGHQSAPYSEVDRTGLPILARANSSRLAWV
jgi:hypothetical protein